jgi:tetratricopeptide (TPR) repeat protein
MLPNALIYPPSAAPLNHGEGGVKTMETKSKVFTTLAVGFCVTALFLLCGCSPGTVPSWKYLDSANHHVQSGMKLLSMGKYDDAMRDFDEAKALESNLSGAYVGSGLVLGYRGNFREAFHDMTKAVALAKNEPERIDAHVGLIRLYAFGKATGSPRWLERAEEIYETVIENSPENSAANYFMGEAYREAGDYQNAKVLYRRVLEIDGTYVVEAQNQLTLIQGIQREKKGL